MSATSIVLICNTPRLHDEVHAALCDFPARVELELPEVGDFSEFIARIGAIRTDVVLIDLTSFQGSLEYLVRQIKAAPGERKVFALHVEADRDAILSALRAGVDEYLYIPVRERLREALQVITMGRARRRSTVRGAGKLIGFLSAKGGCGASSIACHIAAQLGRIAQTQADGHALLADLDLNAGIVRFLMKSSSSRSIVDAIENLNRLDTDLWQTLVSSNHPGLDVLASPEKIIQRPLPGVSEMKLLLSFFRSHYLWTVLDLGRSHNELALNIIKDIDELYLIAVPDVASLYQAKQILGLLADREERDRVRLVLNRIWEAPDDIIYERLEAILGMRPFAILPSAVSAFNEAYSEGRLLGPDAPMVKELRRIAIKIAGVPEDGRPGKGSLSRLAGPLRRMGRADSGPDAPASAS